MYLMPSEVNKILAKANDRLAFLIEKTIFEKKLVDTRAMVENVTTRLYEKGNNIQLDLGVMFYYKYLDDGTRYISQRNITQDMVNSKAFDNLMTEVLTEYYEYKILNNEH